MAEQNKYVSQEQEILAQWQRDGIFEKSLAQTKDGSRYSFYDGPPFATGTPHYGHIVASVMKDVVPRFWTMRGRYVERRWGWDCHGLPIENIVEKELGFKSKKDIEAFGIDKFNEACRSKVLGYVEDWRKTITRLGRWVDFDGAYSTMDAGFMESVWWVFQQLHERGLVYKDYRSIHICPRCETTLSQQEVSEGYKDIKDLSVVAEFELVDEPGTFILAWTTTPWTLPGNVALAVGADVEYVCIEKQDQDTNSPVRFILAKQLLEKYFDTEGYALAATYTGSELVGKKYRPLFSYYDTDALQNRANGFKIYAADFVTTQDGTGVVHIAPAFGEDDMRLGREQNLPFIQHVGMDGRFTEQMGDGFAGMHVKPIDDVQKTDVEIIKYLANKGLLFSKEKYEHAYPHCWRCDTPLINYATSSWFVKVTAVKAEAQKLAEQIHWSPEHIKQGRFGKWLEGARDWSVSRQRFWASVIPIWECDSANCQSQVVVGSLEGLRKYSGQTITDLHKHVVDRVTWQCTCGGTMRRIPDVLDTWFDSGSMPYAQQHYPFENKEIFEQSFPAEFIAEGVDQTRAWFYYLHVIASAITQQPAFKNVIVNGIVLAEDGKKMSKKLKNYPDPNGILDTYGADALRYYLLSSPVMEAENLNFSEKGVKEALQKVVMLLDNVVSFYGLYATDKAPVDVAPQHILDRWIVAKLHQLISDVTTAMEQYQLVKAVRPIEQFIDELSTWYVRRSRDRFKDGDTDAVATLGYVLSQLCRVMAPFTPFIAEAVYQKVVGGQSVHLEQWPAAQTVDQSVITDMSVARQIVERGLAARAAAGVKIRQPLQSYTTDQATTLDVALAEIVCDELNVKELHFGTEALDTVITETLRLEGEARELIRHINQLRKESGLTIQDRVVIYQQGFDAVVTAQRDGIMKATLATDIVTGAAEKMKSIEGGSIGLHVNS